MDPTLLWILGGGLLMSAFALVGAATLLFSDRMLARIVPPLVAFAAGTLIGGAFFHMLPVGLDAGMPHFDVLALVLLGFTVFFALEQFLHWHHCRQDAIDRKKPQTYLILIGDGLHNFLGGLAVAGAFLIDIRLGIVTWVAAAAHEVPQELGDFAVLVHGGWERRRALLFNVLSALTFLVGGMVAYAASFRLDVSFLVPFAAGNFIYIAASDLIPEVRSEENAADNLVHLAAFVGGIGLMWAIQALFGH